MSTALAAGMADFIRACEAHSQPVADGDLAAMRRQYRALCDALNPPRPAGIATRDLRAPGAPGGVPLRLYWRGTAGDGGDGDGGLILFCHGGGWLLGDLHSHDYYCARLAADCACRVLAVDYRLAPEHRYPAALDDAAAALAFARDALGADGAHTLLCGDSAGGNLCAALAARERDAGRALAGQMLIYPALGGDQLGLASYAEQADAPLLSRADMDFYVAAYLGGEAGGEAGGDIGGGRRGERDFAPLLDDDFRGLPPSLLLPVELDPLRDDSAAYAERLRAAGVAVELQLARGAVHGSLRALGRSAVIDRQHALLCDFARRRLPPA